MVNWKTSLFGAIAAVATALQAVDTGDWKMYVAAAATALFAFFARDYNVTSEQAGAK